jgi:DNA-binding CsgD family transcriptional regulator
VGFLVDALIERGELDEAQAALDRSGIGEEVAGEMLAQAYLVARRRLRFARGRIDDAVADLAELGRMAAGDGWSVTVGTPTFRTYLAPALAALGDEDRARALAVEEVALARAWGAPRAIGTALRVQGIVDVGSLRIELLREAAEVLATAAARLEHARALADLGAALRRAGQASAARDPLTEAIDLAHRCGAWPLVAFAQDELAATGHRRRRRLLLRGVESLTPSEQRIARMAADGMSNGEIAQALFLSRKTIEMHLGHAYSKLGVRSRAELQGALSESSAANPHRSAEPETV